MVGLYKDPNGERIFSTRNGTYAVSQPGPTADDKKMVINAYEKRIKELECQLKKEQKVSPMHRKSICDNATIFPNLRIGFTGITENIQHRL